MKLRALALGVVVAASALIGAPALADGPHVSVVFGFPALPVPVAAVAVPVEPAVVVPGPAYYPAPAYYGGPAYYDAPAYYPGPAVYARPVYYGGPVYYRGAPGPRGYHRQGPPCRWR
jgi:hypothetical protein